MLAANRPAFRHRKWPVFPTFMAGVKWTQTRVQVWKAGSMALIEHWMQGA
ncbi:hypothetical protein CHELA20_52998 [Hyphomicrobiales bacterium]|nr:hypothetical protein CHELA41_21925 [Hyphomicrobiales bacterium]CAH1683370.1 hypothetical protein CHELA20_52998 [Hyphomicrobiales bacterium]